VDDIKRPVEDTLPGWPNHKPNKSGDNIRLSKSMKGIVTYIHNQSAKLACFNDARMLDRQHYAHIVKDERLGSQHLQNLKMKK